MERCNLHPYLQWECMKLAECSILWFLRNWILRQMFPYIASNLSIPLMWYKDTYYGCLLFTLKRIIY
jgi:hypothetical protein